MADAQHEHNETIFTNLVDDPPVPHSDSPGLDANQLLAAGGSWVIGEIVDGPCDALGNLMAQLAQLPAAPTA